MNIIVFSITFAITKQSRLPSSFLIGSHPVRSHSSYLPITISIYNGNIAFSMGKSWLKSITLSSPTPLLSSIKNWTKSIAATTWRSRGRFSQRNFATFQTSALVTFTGGIGFHGEDNPYIRNIRIFSYQKRSQRLVFHGEVGIVNVMQSHISVSIQFKLQTVWLQKDCVFHFVAEICWK